MNFLVVNARPVDVRGYGGEQAVDRLKAATLEDMNFMGLARQHDMASKYYMGFAFELTTCRAIQPA